MARGSSKCPNCKATIRGESDYCEKCGTCLFYHCQECMARWAPHEGSFCPLCGEEPENP